MSDNLPPQQHPVPPAPPVAPPYAAPPAAGYQPPAYPAPAYGYGQPLQKTNVLAVVSMIASIVGFVWILPFIGSIGGIIMGHISLSQIARSGEKGRGMALAGLIVGYVGLAFVIIGVIIFVSFFSWAATQGANFTEYSYDS